MSCFYDSYFKEPRWKRYTMVATDQEFRRFINMNKLGLHGLGFVFGVLCTMMIGIACWNGLFETGWTFLNISVAFTFTLATGLWPFIHQQVISCMVYKARIDLAEQHWHRTYNYRYRIY